MDARNAREEAEWPQDLCSGDLGVLRCETDCLRADYSWGPSQVTLTVPHVIDLVPTSWSLHVDEDRRLSDMIAEMIAAPP